MEFSLMVLAQAHCLNLVKNSIGLSFSTLETKAIALSESAHKGTVALWMCMHMKNANVHIPVWSDRLLI